MRSRSAPARRSATSSPAGGSNLLKTLEIGRERDEGRDPPLPGDRHHGRTSRTPSAPTGAIRAHFLDPAAPLYTVYVFDDGTACTQVPHRFFASVNGDMIWSGFELARLTGKQAYRAQSLATARAAASDLNDAAGVFTDLQAENDIAEPLVEAMLARWRRPTRASPATGSSRTRGQRCRPARPTARSAASATGRPPRAAVTAWQTAGGLALEIAAGALDPSGSAQPVTGVGRGASAWNARLGRPGRSTSPDRRIAILGTLGEKPAAKQGTRACSSTGARPSTAPGSGRTSRARASAFPAPMLFAWRWPRPGPHTIQFEPGVPNAKEGGSFLHVRAYLVLH